MGDDKVTEGCGRLRLGTTGWWIWEHFALRSAGFPMRELTERIAVDADDTTPDASTSEDNTTEDNASADHARNPNPNP